MSAMRYFSRLRYRLPLKAAAERRSDPRYQNPLEAAAAKNRPCHVPLAAGAFCGDTPSFDRDMREEMVEGILLPSSLSAGV